jgi:DNA polymerase III subunit gamma/tau
MVMLKSRESLAVKYRPKKLEDLIGQEQIVSLLQGQFKSKTGINRSFLLSGPTGCGKTSLGRILAHYVNCEDFNTDTCSPCGSCSYCKDVAKGYYGGVDEINFSSERGIDTVRSVIDSTAYASQYNAHVFICDEIQSITGAGQNALLKLLEEPPEGVMLLLLTTDPQKLLPTIINRCCPLTLERVEVNDIATHLLKICRLEKRDYFTPKDIPNTDPEYEKAFVIFKNIAMFSNGLVRQALATLEAVLCMIEGGQKFDYADPISIKKIVGKFIDNPDTEINIAQYLIAGVYSGRYSLAISYALKITQQQSGSVKQFFDKVLDYVMQTLYFMVDPNKKIGNLTDPFFSQWYASMLQAVKSPGAFQLTYLSASELVNIILELITQLGLYVHDERKLVVAYTLRMLESINKHKETAYTKASLFHKIHAPDLLKDK